MGILDQIARGTTTSPMDIAKAGSQGRSDAMSLQGASQKLQMDAMKIQAYTEEEDLRKRSRAVMRDADLSTAAGTREASQELFNIGNIEMGLSLEGDADKEEGAIAQAAARKLESDKMYSFKDKTQKDLTQYRVDTLEVKKTETERKRDKDNKALAAKVAAHKDKMGLGLKKLDASIDKTRSTLLFKSKKLDSKINYQKEQLNLATNKYTTQISQFQDKLSESAKELSALIDFRDRKNNIASGGLRIKQQKLNLDIKKAKNKYELDAKALQSLVKKRNHGISIDERKLNVLINDKTDRLKLDQDRLDSLNSSRANMLEFSERKLAEWSKYKSYGGSKKAFKGANKEFFDSTAALLKNTIVYEGLEKDSKNDFVTSLSQAVLDLMTENKGLTKTQAMEQIRVISTPFINNEGVIWGIDLKNPMDKNKFDKEGFTTRINELMGGSIVDNNKNIAVDDYLDSVVGKK